MRFPMLQPVTEMTKTALGTLLAPGAEEYLDMFHDDAVFEFPYNAGGALRIEGRAAMADFLTKIEGTIVFDDFDLREAYAIPTDLMVLEYHSKAHIVASGLRFEQDYVAVLKTSAGRIHFYREYFNPLKIPGA